MWSVQEYMVFQFCHIPGAPHPKEMLFIWEKYEQDIQDRDDTQIGASNYVRRSGTQT